MLAANMGKPIHHLAVALGLALLLSSLGAPHARGAAPADGLGVVYAVTLTSEGGPGNTIYLADVGSADRRQLYRDERGPDRILARVGQRHINGSARVLPPGDVYFAMGLPNAEPARGADALSRLRITDTPAAQAPEPLFLLPLCFSQESPYALWDRAPALAVSHDGARFALSALRIGDAAFELPAIRVLSAHGAEMWRIALNHAGLRVADLAWSADGRWLAYLVIPAGGEHGRGAAPSPEAGLYLADSATRTTRLLYGCYGEALAWGPRQDRITVGARVGPPDGGRYVARVVALPSGKVVEEFSLRGRVRALSYSPDGLSLAVQTVHMGRQQIWLHPASGGWGRLFLELPEGDGELSLLGWARANTDHPE